MHGGIYSFLDVKMLKGDPLFLKYLTINLLVIHRDWFVAIIYTNVLLLFFNVESAFFLCNR